MKDKRVLLITQTAVFIALLVSAQAFTRPFGQFVTGSSVNFILVASCVLAGIYSAAAVAVVSPVFAYLIVGVPLFPQIIPFIMAGNLALVIAIYFISGRKSFGKLNLVSYLRIGAAVLVGAALKFLVLWLGIVNFVLTIIPDIKPPQVDAMSAAFSWPQLITALIGASLAMAVMPNLMKALKQPDRAES